MKNIWRIIFVLLVCGISFASTPSYAAEVAVVDVASVIDSSLPGKAGQKYIDKVKSDLEAELDRYVKGLAGTVDKQALTSRKHAEIAERFNQEFARVSDILLEKLREAAHSWLKNNKSGVKVLISGSSVMAVSPEADVSADILRLLNKVTIDFTKNVGSGR
ncbi:hypothetical protein [Cloacibacillus evryensis]|uniref:hypothetical protein n=1 Tax=Cloacibacillus evryensis TaxID=508460 RepID=UPI00210C7706|nr:hypothetical protein [Cloacibacillus evryensis]MCQ4764691.1 hypothetical protein [Cloacibacillus evryensis]